MQEELTHGRSGSARGMDAASGIPESQCLPNPALPQTKLGPEEHCIGISPAEREKNETDYLVDRVMMGSATSAMHGGKRIYRPILHRIIKNRDAVSLSVDSRQQRRARMRKAEKQTIQAEKRARRA